MPQQPTVAIPKRLPLIVEPENRDNTTNKDAKLVNAYVDRRKDGGVDVYRRPGQIVFGNPSGASHPGQGAFYWNHAVYSIFNGTLYKNLVATTLTGMDTSNGVYSFSSIMGATPKLVMQNGIQGYAFDDVNGGSATLHSLSPSYPQFTVKGLCFLDGTMYVTQHFFGTSITPAVIWGSGINDVTTPNIWDPLNFITAQIEPDSGVYTAKQLVYVVCMKEWTTEFFFDAGNATGSPLQAAENLQIAYGCATGDSVQTIAEVLFWISTNREASNQVVMMDHMQLRVISDSAIDRLLNQADLTIVYSWQVKLNGHSFYVMTIKNANITMAYDINTGMWEQWTDVNGNYMPIVCSCRDGAGHHILQHETNGNLYYMDSAYTDDAGLLIPVTIITPNYDAETVRVKQLSMMFFHGDRNIGSSIQVSWSDDDYITWSTPRAVDMGQNKPRLPDCGTFQRRAFKIQVLNNAAFRMRSIELQYDVGVL